MTVLICTTNFSSVECSNCHMLFALTQQTKDDYQETHETFYCPKGHRQWYPSKSNTEKLQEKLAVVVRDRNYWEGQHGKEVRLHNATEARRRAQKGVVTKLKKRAVNGICPCCSRTFVNLKRHMENKHPDFSKDDQ